jgi:hypothetical protein
LYVLSGVCFLAGIAATGMFLFHIIFTNAEVSLYIVHETPTPYPTRTPRPTVTHTATPSPTLQPIRLGSGWFNWWGKTGDDEDRRVFMRYRSIRAGTPVRVCWFGEAADENLNWQRLVTLDEPKCVAGIVSSAYDSPLPAGVLVGAIGAGVRRELLGFDSELWPMLNLAITYTKVGSTGAAGGKP